MEIEEYIALWEKFNIIEAYDSMVFVNNIKVAMSGMSGTPEE